MSPSLVAFLVVLTAAPCLASDTEPSLTDPKQKQGPQILTTDQSRVRVATLLQDAGMTRKAAELLNGEKVSISPESLAKIAKADFQQAADRADAEAEKSMIGKASSYFVDGLEKHPGRFDADDLINLDQTVLKAAVTSNRVYGVLSDPSLSAEERYSRWSALQKDLGPLWKGQGRGHGDGQHDEGFGGERGGWTGTDKGHMTAQVMPPDGQDPDKKVIEGMAKFSVWHGMFDILKEKQIPFPPAAPPPAPNHPPAPPPPSIGEIIGGLPAPNVPSDAISSAQDKLSKGDVGGAMDDYDRAIGMGGGAPALAGKSGLELDLKNYGSALQDAQAALQIDPSNKEALAVYHFAKDHGDGGGAPAATNAGQRGFASVAGGRAGSVTYGTAGSGGSAAAAAAARSMSGAQAQKAGVDALKVGDASGALAYLDRAVAQDPNNPATRNLRAAVFARLHQYDKAAEDAKAGLALAPGNKALLRTLAYSQLRNKDYKGSLATANTLLGMDPTDAYALAMRAHAYGSMGDRDAMMSDINRAAELDPRFAQAAAAAGSLQLPSNSDVLFLFPGEVASQAAAAAAPAPASRSRKFGAVAGVALVGGVLLALGLLKTVLAPLKAQVTSVFTRITGRTPAAAAESDTARPASAAGHMPGLIRGQYEIARQIGAGGMGMVFEGTDRSLGRRVAIKKMRDELRVNPQERARFVIEAKTVAALHHPHIVDIYAIAEDGDDVYLIFEYVDGQTVHDVVQRSGRLQPAQAFKIVRAAADALAFAHSKGVIHRDMKPSNMMLDTAGRLKVMDFGIARMAKDAMTRYSMTNTVVGTPPYMAPEQEQGQVRRESDVYALAICAYEMLTGKLPFAGIGAGMLMNKINMSFIPPSRATAGVPEALDAVFQKAFQADPEQRYRTPQEFADALESASPATARA